MLPILLLLGCHLGRPPVSGPAAGAAERAGLATTLVSVGRVDAPVAEPALGEDLRRAVSSGLADRQALGAGPSLELAVLSASTELVAVEGDRRVQRARLVVEARLLGHAPRTVVLRGERSYDLSSTDGLAAAQHRAAAFRSLSDELGQDLAAWVLLAPTAPDPAP